MDSSLCDYSSYEELGISKADGILTVTIRNSARRNALGQAQAEELGYVWDDAWRDREVSVIVLTGEGGDFCSGADVTQLASGDLTRTGPQRAPVNPISRGVKKHLFGILDCEKPTIAKVRGVAYGLGASTALACDFVYAAPGARFCDPHVRGGMVAGDGGVLLWPLLIGMRRAKRHLMLGEPLGAESAAEMGLITDCVADDELDDVVQEVAEKLRDLPPHAVNYTKSALNAAMRNMAGSAFEISLAYEMYSMGMNDFAKAAKALAEKKNGIYNGN